MTDTAAHATDRPTKLARDYALHYPVSRPFAWLKAGLRDTFTNPATSLVYGLAVFLGSWGIIVGVLVLDLAHFLLPCLAGFVVIGPALAAGLYQKSEFLTKGRTPGWREVFLVKPGAAGQIFFIGVLLLLLMVLWLRTAFLLYALFFGLLPFGGWAATFELVLTTPLGWMLIGVGSAVGSLFAAFGFAISVFSIPMLLNNKIDVFSAMGHSMSIAWNNKSLMIAWGAIVVALSAIGFATGLIGLIVVFPILGHATWYAYQDCAKVIDPAD